MHAAEGIEEIFESINDPRKADVSCSYIVQQGNI